VPLVESRRDLAPPLLPPSPASGGNVATGTRWERCGCGVDGSALGRPGFNRPSEPEVRTIGTEVDHRPGHIGVATLVQADAVGLGKTEEAGDFVRVNEVLGAHEWTHDKQRAGCAMTAREVPSRARKSPQHQETPDRPEPCRGSEIIRAALTRTSLGGITTRLRGLVEHLFDERELTASRLDQSQVSELGWWLRGSGRGVRRGRRG